MSKKRVLVLHSFKDKGYEARLQQIANNPSLDEISFRHCCMMIDRDRPSARSKEVVKEEAGPMLDKQITEFNPEVVIIHGGTIFNLFSDTCLTMIIDLMKKHPGLPFALEGKREWLSRRVEKTYDLFEEGVATDRIRWARHNFIDDDEVEEIIKDVFG